MAITKEEEILILEQLIDRLSPIVATATYNADYSRYIVTLLIADRNQFFKETERVAKAKEAEGLLTSMKSKVHDLEVETRNVRDRLHEIAKILKSEKKVEENTHPFRD